MKKNFSIFRSFRFKVIAAMVVLMVFAGALSNFAIYEYSLRSRLEQLRDKLMTVAQAIALTIDADTILKIPLNKQAVDTMQYRSIEERLLTIKKLLPSVSYIYILKKAAHKGIFQFVIDVHPADEKAEIAPAYPGKGYDASGFPELAKAFNGPSADRQITTDAWGEFLSGYAPIRGADGNTAAILGIDMSARNVHDLQREVRARALSVLVLGIVFSLVLGIIVSGRVTKPVNELLMGTRHISSGDLQYQVKVKGADEIAELGASFNQMAKRLAAAKRALLNYFYRVVQSLIRALEAKDAYTKGHSDRVAEYAEKTAIAMGLSKEKVELLKESALLHDIGKLGIQEVVLNKKAMLTPEERKDIERHPVVGEEILKPVSPDPEILAVIREHHERYDGKGYPAGLSGDRINLLAAIVSVADSYDAMTSHRAYSTDLSPDGALEQLEKNSGLQFNPVVVEAFIKAMKGT